MPELRHRGIEASRPTWGTLEALDDKINNVLGKFRKVHGKSCFSTEYIIFQHVQAAAGLFDLIPDDLGLCT